MMVKKVGCKTRTDTLADTHTQADRRIRKVETWNATFASAVTRDKKDVPAVPLSSTVHTPYMEG